MEKEVVEVIIPQPDGTYKVVNALISRKEKVEVFDTIEAAVVEVCMRKLGV